MSIIGIPPKPQAPPKPEAFKPEFERKFVRNSQTGVLYPVNPWYTATLDTAAQISLKLGAPGLIEEPLGMGSGPIEDVTGWFVIFTDGLKVNAGVLASYWTRNPEDQFPGVALQSAKAVLYETRKELDLLPKEPSNG